MNDNPITLSNPHCFQRLPRKLVDAITERITPIHPGLSLLSGPPGTGKTEIAQDIAAHFNQSTGKAALYMAFTMEARRYTCAQMLSLLHEMFLGPLTKRLRQQKAEILAQEVVHRLRTQGTQWLFLDEAGLLSHEGLNALQVLYDAAKHIDHPLSCLLIGNDDLPLKVQHRPQLETRIKETVYIEPYSYDQLYEVLPQLDLTLQHLSDDERTRLCQFLHHVYAGNLRATQAYLERLHVLWQPPQPLEQVLIQAAHDRADRAKQKATDDALHLARKRRK